MRKIEVHLPDRLTAELDVLVQQGWFVDETEVIRLALREFLQRNRLALEEELQREDIAWALSQRKEKPGTGAPE